MVFLILAMFVSLFMFLFPPGVQTYSCAPGVTQNSMRIRKPNRRTGSQNILEIDIGL
jgi:hypothetical protein